MNGQRFHQRKRSETNTEQCERSLRFAYKGILLFKVINPNHSVFASGSHSVKVTMNEKFLSFEE